jgi:hypothetical protein
MWCPVPLPEGEIQRRKLRSDKYKPPVGHLLENYESNSLVEADEDTDAEAGADLVVGTAKSWRRTRSTVAKKSASAVATAISAVKAAEQKKSGRGGKPPLRPSRHQRSRRLALVRSGRRTRRGRRRRKRMRPSKSCRSLKIR